MPNHDKSLAALRKSRPNVGRLSVYRLPALLLVLVIHGKRGYAFSKRACNS